MLLWRRVGIKLGRNVIIPAKYGWAGVRIESVNDDIR